MPPAAMRSAFRAAPRLPLRDRVIEALVAPALSQGLARRGIDSRTQNQI